MKNKNILLFGAIGVGLYYLLKKDKPSTVSGTTSTTESTDTSASYKLPFTKKDLLGADRTIVLTEDVGMTKRMSAVLEYKLPYRGGARPTPFMERTSGMWIVKGNLPNLKATKVCKGAEMDIMPFGIPFDDERNCKTINHKNRQNQKEQAAKIAEHRMSPNVTECYRMSPITEGH